MSTCQKTGETWFLAIDDSYICKRKQLTPIVKPQDGFITQAMSEDTNGLKLMMTVNASFELE
jgi:hypothetical protein